MRKINLKKIIKLLSVVSFALLSITDGLFVSKNINSSWISYKYIPMIITILLFFAFRLKNVKLNNIFNNEFKKLTLIILTMLFISIFLQIINNHFSLNTYEIFIKIFLGILFSYTIIKTQKFDDIYDIMKYNLLFTIIGYIIQIGYNNFTIENLLRMNFINSYSPLESHYFASAFLCSSIFFTYYNKNRVYKIISIVFTILTFKRLSILFVIFISILPFFVNIDHVIKSKKIAIIPIIFVLLTIGFHWILQPNNEKYFLKVFNDSPTHFTTGRNIRLNEVESKNFKSYGLGSAANELGLEMLEIDLVEIYIELSIFCLIIFIFGFWSINGGHIYCIIFMMFLLFNYLTAGSMSNSYIWARNIIIIASLKYYNDEKYIGKRPNFINKLRLRRNKL